LKNITRTLSSYIVASKYDALPADLRHEGVRAFVNWVGCAAGGVNEDNVQHALAFLLEFNGAPEATVVGRREKLDILNATLINSMSSGALTFNDTHYATVAHPTSPVAAAVMALAERKALSGTEFVHALILGNEIQCRVGNMLCVPPAECQVGWSMAGLVSGIGAAVAAAKVLGLDEAATAAAIGMAANQASGLREAHGTMASQFTPGHSARCGLVSALMAARGFTCSESMLEGPKGFAQAFAQHPNMDVAVDKLGEKFEMSTLAYKPYPCGFVIHPIIDACLEIAQKETLYATHIERIEISVNPLAVQLTDRPAPQNRNQALVSLQHWAVASLLYKAAGIAQVTEAVVHDSIVAALRHKVLVNCSDTIGREAASVRVILDGGRSVAARVQRCRGSAGRPLTDTDLTEKTRGQLLTVFPVAETERILADCWNIEEYSRVDPLCKQLAAVG